MTDPRQALIESAWDNRQALSPSAAPQDVRQAVESVLADLDADTLRVATRSADAAAEGAARWNVHQWIKKAVLMLFSLQRPDIVSYGDLAILRGMRMLYRHRAITPQLFARYRRRYSPYGSTASLYLWAIAGGALPELTDPGRSGKSKK